MGAGILTEAALGFLGFGVRPPEVSLGTLVSDYQGAYSTRPWLFIWPGVFVVAIVLCLQFVGDGLRDAFDPRQKRVPKRKDLEAGGAGEIRGDIDPVAAPHATGRRAAACDSDAATPRPRATRATAISSVPTCQRTGARSRSSRGSSR